MYYIKSCPTCGSKIRFPLDKGKIKVTCQCGYSFIADPDDKALYKEGSFDLSDSKRSSPSNKIFSRLSSFNITNMKETIIKSIYKAKYTLQNFKLLPSDQQRKVIIIILIALALAGAAIFLIARFSTRTPSANMI